MLFRGYVVALLGAESTGKTTLAVELRDAASRAGHDSVTVPEYLREFCDLHGRTPRRAEQPEIARTQTRRIDRAARAHGVVIADTSALMTAVYSDQVFGDATLYDDAIAAHAAGCDLTLLTALDLPWRPDGLQRDGPQVRAPVDGKLRKALDRGRIPYAVVYGCGAARAEAAWSSVSRALEKKNVDVRVFDGPSSWHWHCDRCGGH